MKNVKRLIFVFLVIVCVLSFVVPVNAYYKDTGLSFSRKEGGFLGIGAKTYYYSIYKDTGSWYAMFADCTPIKNHIQGAGDSSLVFSVSATYSSETSASFSTTVGATVGVPEVCSLTCSTTSSITQTVGFSVAASGAVGQIIPSASKTGYYKMSICYNFARYKVYKHGSGYFGDLNKNYLAAYSFSIPVGSAYVSTLYSTTTIRSTFSKFYP